MFDKNDELQSDNGEFLEADYEEALDAEPEDELEDESPVSESEPDSDTEHEAKDGEDTLNDFSKEKVNERFGKLTREAREAERRAKAAEERAARLEEQSLHASKPVIPDLPDPDEVSDAEFAQALKARDEAIYAQQQWQYRVNQHQQQAQEHQQRQQMQRQQEMAKTVESYNKRAKAMNVKPEELQQAAAVISQVGLNDDLAMHILNDERGALITRHLGNNVQDLLDVASMTPVQAALHIERVIKPRLAAPKRKSSTPPPPSRVKGGTPDKNDRYPLSGGKVKFE